MSQSSPRFLHEFPAAAVVLVLVQPVAPQSDARSLLLSLVMDASRPGRLTLSFTQAPAQTNDFINVLFAERFFNDNHVTLRQLVY
jgi:hypothetical protein